MNTPTLNANTVTCHHGSFVKSAWECWLEVSTLSCQITGTTWDWYTQAFFSEAAMRRYIWLGQMIACLVMLTFLFGKLTWLRLQPRIDAFVESCKRQQSQSDLHSILVLPVSTVHEVELPEKNESILTICTLHDTPYSELKALAKSLGHPKPHMTKKLALIDWIQSHQA